MNKDFLFTSESVSEGHPDKICDQISDSIVDAFLRADPYARAAIETMVTTDRVIIVGEARGPEKINAQLMEELACQTIQQIGYDQEGFSHKTVNVDVHVHSQSADIAAGVDAAENKDEGAGDQGIMFGYACDETPALMPAPIFYAHRILQDLAEGRHAGTYDFLGPDAKSQVTLAYENGRPVRATSVVVSTQHNAQASQEDVRRAVLPCIERNLPAGWMPPADEIYINPTGRFVIGGPVGDAGLTGRKIIVDTYGGAAPHGGGAFSGKDPTKVDRSAAYAARYLAKNIVAAGLATRCTIQLSYAIGVSHPLSIFVNMHSTGLVDSDDIVAFIREHVDLSPRGIREALKLNNPIYLPTASYGHFGRDPNAKDGTFTWEKTDLVAALKAAFPNIAK